MTSWVSASPSPSVAVCTKEMPEIPLEILSAILSLLPAKSLMRFRCVSKPWCALIGSRDFVKMHLKQAQESARFHKLVLRRDDSGTILSADVDSLDQAIPLNLPCFPTDFSSSCNGLILLVDENNSLVIWNPFTRKYTTLPPLPMEPENASSFRKTKVTNTKYGFGYDSVNDDYKVLRALTWQSSGNEHLGFGGEAKIYSLKSNTWKKTLHSPAPIPDSGKWAAHVNGALHTLVSKRYIIGFDLATEESHRILLPDGLQVDIEESHEFPPEIEGLGLVDAFNFTVIVDVLDLTVVALNGFLCLHCKGKKNHNIDIWIMKEYGVKESWTKLLSLAPPLIPNDASVFPITFSISGQKVLLNVNYELVWFDLKRDAFNEAVVQGSRDGGQVLSVSHAEFCVETIDSPDRYGEGVIDQEALSTGEET